MKLSIIMQICPILILIVLYQENVLGQTMYPYGGAPIVYDNHGDDDLGLILTVLLLAARNTNGNCNCCNCYNCGGGAKTIPVPFPIPFPTNNPIINNPQSGYGNTNESEEESEEVEEGSHSSNESSGYEKSSSNLTLSYVPVPVGSQESD